MQHLLDEKNPFADTFVAVAARCGAPWTHEQSDFWWLVTYPGAARPRQGWKLHVSANLHAASQILQRTLAVLARHAVCFKFTRAPAQLAALNRGDGSASQIGKFITVYPCSDAQAVALARDLDLATSGMSGPAIASDRRLHPRSLVHYRYGSFGGEFLQTSIGPILPGIRATDGTLVPDRRGTSFHAPADVVDPFAAAGLVTAPPDAAPLLHGRFYPMGTIYSSPSSTVSLAVDIVAGRRCVLKSVRADLTLGDTDIPASQLLRREAEVLRSLADVPGVPTLYDLIEGDERSDLVMEDIAGVTFEQVIAMRRETQRPLTTAEVVAWAAQVASALREIHARGYAYLDLKPTNLIVTPDNTLRLIDFDAVSPLAQERRGTRGTRGYLSPQRRAGGPSIVQVGDDIYALGALLYLVVTGAEPSLAPDPGDLLARPLAVMAPTLHPGLATLVERCLAQDLASMDEILAALAALDVTTVVPNAPFGSASIVAPPGQHRELARKLTDTLVAVARPVHDGEGLGWSSSHPTGAGMQSRDINSGSAGSLLALCELASELADPRLLAAVQQGALALERTPRPEGAPVPGLYVGEAGVIAALLRAAQVLHDPRWLAAAEARSAALAELPFGSPDLFNGTAGRLRVHLALYAETHDEAQLARARRCGDELLACATVDADGWRWHIPPGYESMSGDAYLGYAHGAAGIADALLDLHSATGDPRVRAAVSGAAQWIVRHAVTPEGLPDASAWPSRAGDPPAASFWCHGATGIGVFLLRAGVAGVVADGLAWARRAAWSAARSARWASPTQCHGLAGNLEFLLDCYQATGDLAYHNEAHVLAFLLERFIVVHDAHTVCASESPTVFSPDYMVGYAGVATCLLRLASPLRPPPLRLTARS